MVIFNTLSSNVHIKVGNDSFTTILVLSFLEFHHILIFRQLFKILCQIIDILIFTIELLGLLIALLIALYFHNYF